MQFTKSEFNAFRGDFEKAVEELERKYAVKIHLGSISYKEVDFNASMHVTRTDVDADAINFLGSCALYGFRQEHYRDEFSDSKSTYMLVGFNSKRSKNNCRIVDTRTGKEYLCPDTQVKRALNIQ